MRRINTTAFFLLSILNSLFSQNYSREFGNVSEAEVNMTSYSKDPQAEAVVIYDIGDSKFIDIENGYNILFTRHCRIKILSKAGIRYSEVSIPFYRDNEGGTELVESIVGYSYNNDNGTIAQTGLNLATVYTEKINNNWSVMKFAFPNVKPGTVIEYKYSLRSPFHFNLMDWEFQQRIPIMFSKYTVRMIPFYEYKYIAQGITKFYQNTALRDTQKRSFGDVSQVYGQNVGRGIEFYDMVYSFEMKDIPAFRDESYITSASDYIMKMDFQLAKINYPQGGVREIMTTWPTLIADLLSEDVFGKYLNTSEKLAKNILEKEIPLKDKNGIEKCQAIINYVKSKYTWNGFNAKTTTITPKEFINQKKGNIAEINLFMTALLNAAGIDASPVLLSTRDNGKIQRNYPFISFFNYVVVLVTIDKEVFLSDGSDPFVPFNRIPPKCINENGLVISKGEEKWVSLDLKYNSTDLKVINISVDPESLNLKTSLVIQASEYDSYWYKKTFSNDTIEIKKYLTGKGFAEISKIQTMNYDKNNSPFIIRCDGTYEAERLENKIIVLPFMNFIPRENDLTQLSRNYPVDLTYSNTESFITTVSIPKGFKVINLPAAFKSETDIADLNLEFKESDGVVEVVGSYRFKKAVYLPAEYSQLKAVKELIIKIFNEPIIFEKL